VSPTIALLYGRDPITDRAADFLLRVVSGDATEGDREEIVSWRAEDPRHEIAYHDAVRLWRGLGAAAAAAAPANA
jgi:transmembrane sensor